MRRVTTVNDSGPGSLRAQISAARPGDVIRFSVSGFFFLSGGELVISKDLVLEGPTDATIYLEGDPEGGRILRIAKGNVQISNLNLFNGTASGVAGVDGAGAHPNGTSGGPGDGGAIYNAGNLKLLNCTFASNQAGGGRAGNAAGLGYQAGNAGPGRGGAIFNKGTLTAINCCFTNNSARAPFGGSGSPQGTAGNGGDGQGGAIANFGRMNLINCTIIGNLSLGGTGGTGNTTGRGGNALGGGVLHAGAVIVFQNTIVATNEARAGSGGYNSSSDQGPPGMVTGPQVASITTGFTSAGHNLIGPSEGASGWIQSDMTGVVDPKVAPPFSIYDYSASSTPLALLPESPAIDHGDDAVLSAPLNITSDQRGFPRRLGRHVDVGAAEFDPPQLGPVVVVNTLDDHFDAIGGTYDCTLREALGLFNSSQYTTITFAPNLKGTIYLHKPPYYGAGMYLSIVRSLSIQGPGADILSIQGDGTSRIFDVTQPQVQATISGLTIAHGRDATGAAIFSTQKLTINNCVFVDNRASESSYGGSGGAIASSSSTNEPATLALTGCTFNQNATEKDGGAIYNKGGVATITNSTFAANSAERGGAIFSTSTNFQASLTLHSVTLSQNTSTNPSNSGGAVYSESGTTRLRNALIAGNHASQGPDVYGSFTSEGHNLIGIADLHETGLANGARNDQVGMIAPIDPKLSPLGHNGGPTTTMALRNGSPAIDQGAGAPARDQRGYLRRSAADVGAFEFNGTIPVTLGNISTRLRVGTGDDALIGGFIISGTHSKKVIIRGLGPSTGLSGALANPALELHDRNGKVVASNDDWTRASNHGEISQSGLAPKSARESALLMTLSPGAYTVILRGAENTVGIGLVEVYDLDFTTDSRLANISTRGQVQTGDNVMIAGFVVSGFDSQRVIIRGLGPSLAASHLSNTLNDPMLEIYNRQGTIIVLNDNWKDRQEMEITATGIPPQDDREAAVVSTLAPGPYTAILRGKNSSVGIGVIEVYRLQ